MIKKHSKLFILIVIVLGLALLIGGFYNRSEPVYSKESSSVVNNVIPTIHKVEKEEEPFYKWTKEEWEENYNKNNDYVCDIRFESGLVDLPAVQGATNSTYIDTDWITREYNSIGSIFLDYETNYEEHNDIKEDNNIVIYGHYCYPSIDPEQKLMFTPLKALVEEKNYEENKYIQLLFEDEVRRYEVAEVFHCELVMDESGHYSYTRDDMEYFRPYFTKDYMDVFKERIAERRFYDTGIEIDENMKLLTLQTCVADHDELRLIVIAKEIDRQKLEN